jgi:hypothetical protein
MVYRTQGIPERHARLAADLDGARQIGEMSFANLDERVLRLPGPTVPDRVVDGGLKQSPSPAGPGRVPPKRYPDEGIGLQDRYKRLALCFEIEPGKSQMSHRPS